jgi:HTH-type transcriptional regulator, sugar sensing transcriptional regulator
MIETVLKKFGLNDKEISIYLSLLKLGSAPVRAVALQAEINRTTTHDILNKLIDEGLVSFVDKTKHRYFTAESPEHFLHSLKIREQNINRLEQDIKEILPELKSLYEKSESKPKAKYFEGNTGLRAIMEDVLISVGRSSNKQYYVYSSSSIRDTLYNVFPEWNKERIKKNISVQSISIGPGGKLHGMDERKWISKKEDAPTYTMIYAGKLALISLDETGDPIGVVVEDMNTYKTQAMIFKELWVKI